MNDYKVTTTVEVSRDFVQGLFDNTDRDTSPWIGGMIVDVEDLDGASFSFTREEDDEGDYNGVIMPTDESIQNALTLLAANHPSVFHDLMNDNADANTSDLFLQYLALGKVVYG